MKIFPFGTATAIGCSTRWYRGLWVLVTLLLVVSSQAQEYYDDYAQQQQEEENYNYAQQPPDTLYHDYAARHEAGNAPAGAGWGKLMIGTAAGWVVGGKFHSRRLEKKLNAKFKADQKALYQQYYNDVYALQQQNAELMAALEQYAGRRA